MNKKVQNTYSFLILIGLIPFALGICLPLLGITELAIIGDVNFMLATYSLGVAGFMAGIHWGITLVSDNDESHSLTLIASTLMVLLPWAALISYGPGLFFYTAQIIVFIKILAIDRTFYLDGQFTEHYYRLRRFVTVIVVVSLFIKLVQIWL